MFQNEKDLQFYPTPEELAQRISKKIKNRKDKAYLSVLEPSAGKGDLLKALKGHNIGLIECCEIDKDLQAILKSKYYMVVGEDFLEFNTYTQYDLILMNPPFDKGDRHLLKAIEMQKNGGQIICILNAETLKNPYSVYRKDLLQKLSDYNAEIEYIEQAFSNAERQTNVEVAVVNIVIQPIVYTQQLFDELIAGEEFNDIYNEYNKMQLATNDTISNILKQYNDECRIGLTLIDNYEKMGALVPNYSVSPGYDPLINISILSSEKERKSMSNKNLFIRQLRFKYWTILFQTEKIQRLFTEELRDSFRNNMEKMRSFDFTHVNIRKIYDNLSKDLSSNLEKAILKQFDELSYQNSMDKNSNIHYYNGWKTNSAYKIKKKVIIPCPGLFDRFSNWDLYCLRDKLDELEKVLTYLDGGQKEGKSILDLCKKGFNFKYNGEKIYLKYFDIELKKKGTIHLWFTDEELLKKFNIFGANKKGWLPNSYGRKQYHDMTEEEQEIVKSFEGIKEYEDTVKNSNYYCGAVQFAQIGMTSDN